MNYLLEEVLEIDQALEAQDLDTAQQSDWYDMDEYRKAVAILTTEEIAASDVDITVKFEQYDGSTSKDLGDETKITDGGDDNAHMLTAEIDVTEMDDEFDQIRVHAQVDDGTDNIGSVVLVRGNPRYMPV